MQKRLVWGMATVAGVVAAAALALYCIDSGIPFIEGDWVTRSGAAYGFRIGSSRLDVFHVVRTQYALPGNDVRVIWERTSPVHAQLAAFENVESKQWTRERYSYWRQPLSAVTELEPPLQLGDRWDIEMHGGWVNAIYLTFSGERLVEIHRSRGLFERP